MSFEIILVLSVMQGLTEFLPISSSAHLILPSQLLGWRDQGLAFDVAVHVGTLIAVCWYLRKEIAGLSHAWLRSFRGVGVKDAESRLSWLVLWATLPALVAGVILNDLIEFSLRSIEVIATTTIVFGLLLWYADAKGVQQKQNDRMSWSSAMLIGVAQAFALIPGTSRSGVTMTASLLLGFDRQSAAKFSFLLSIPLIGAAGGYKTLELVQAAQPPVWSVIVTGMVLSGVSAYFCIRFFVKLIDRVGMWPFALYRLILGMLLLFLALGARY